MLGRFIFIFCIFSAVQSHAELRLPNGIAGSGQSDHRAAILQELGYGTSSKLIAEPYPMGGYLGLEVSMTYESVPTDRLNINGNSAQDALVFSRVTVGKGLYNNVDIHLSFIPFNSQSSISGYGALAKWTFLEGGWLPSHLSLSVEGDQTNMNNQLITQSLGASLIGGCTFDVVTLYLGGGWLSSSGEFRSPESPFTTANESASNLHWFSGAVLKWDPVFLAAQVDQFQQTMMSFRLGVRL